MKKVIILFILLFGALISIAQWQSDIRLTNNPASSFTPYYNNRALAVNGNVIHVVWIDNRDSNYEIYYKRSTDSGLTWGGDIRLTNNREESYDPSVAVSNSNVMVVWDDNRDGNDAIYFKRSTNQGITWGQDIKLSNSSSYAGNPSISVSGSVVNVFWGDGREINGEIFYKRSLDNGVSWSNDMNLTNNAMEIGSWCPSVSVSGIILHVAWHASYYGIYDIFYKRSNDNGLSWSANQRLTNDQAESYSPSISSSGQFIHVSWFDKRDWDFSIYYKRSTDGGINWGSDTRLTNGYYESLNPSITSSANFVHIVWYDWQAGNYEIYYKRSINSGASWELSTRLTYNIDNSWSPYIAVSGSVVHVVWTDYRDANSEIYYKRNPTGNPVGIKNINSEIPKDFKLHQNYPNPFNPVTKIRFDLPVLKLREAGIPVRLVVYDLLGRETATLVNEQLKPGTYEVEWDGSNFASGVYFYSIITEEFTQTKRMVLVR